MPDINAQERQQVKQESARMAITDANVSQYLAAAAAVATLASPLYTAILAVGAAAMGVCGNYRQAVANDPPRDDFDQVLVTQGILDENLVPTDEPLGTLHRFAAYQLMLSDALYLLLRSLERYDGAISADNLDAANIQADAAQQNAESAAALQDNLILLAPLVNQAWDSLRAEFTVDWNSLTIEQVQQFYRETWGEPPQSPSGPLQEVIQSITGTVDDLLEPFDPVAAHPILSATEVPSEPQQLIDDSYIEELVSLSSALRSLVRSIPNV